MIRKFFIFVLLCFIPMSSVLADEQGASNFIQNLSQPGIEALTSKTLSPAERFSRVKSLVDQNFAVQSIGKWILGRYWNIATPQQQQEYLNLFGSYIVLTYVNKFTSYTGVKIVITKTIPNDANTTMVYTQLTSDNHQRPTEVIWRVSSAGGIYKVTDVVVEGLSMSQTQRDEFSSIISSHGGNVSSLLDMMRQKVM